MPASNLTRIAPADVDSRLGQLGLQAEALVAAVQRGFGAWASCTAHHPPLLPGVLHWGETLGALREYLCGRGWTRSDQGNLSLAISRGGQLAIAVSTGDEGTGKAECTPCTRSSKGPRTAAAVDTNAQLAFWPESTMLSEEEADALNSRETWLLLFHRDMTAREVRSELSLPVALGTDGRVDGWRERILLTPFSFDGTADTLPFDGADVGRDGGFGSEIVVEVRERA
jgi:hypothetical protein